MESFGTENFFIFLIWDFKILFLKFDIEIYKFFKLSKDQNFFFHKKSLSSRLFHKIKPSNQGLKSSLKKSWKKQNKPYIVTHWNATLNNVIRAKKDFSKYFLGQN